VTRWRVEVREHRVGRWHVPARTVEVAARTDVLARLEAVRVVHGELGVPDLRPWVRASYLRTRAERLNDLAEPERTESSRTGITEKAAEPDARSALANIASREELYGWST
jgi:hypothetical protein